MSSSSTRSSSSQCNTTQSFRRAIPRPVRNPPPHTPSSRRSRHRNATGPTFGPKDHEVIISKPPALESDDADKNNKEQNNKNSKKRKLDHHGDDDKNSKKRKLNNDAVPQRKLDEFAEITKVFWSDHNQQITKKVSGLEQTVKELQSKIVKQSEESKKVVEQLKRSEKEKQDEINVLSKKNEEMEKKHNQFKKQKEKEMKQLQNNMKALQNEVDKQKKEAHEKQEHLKQLENERNAEKKKSDKIISDHKTISDKLRKTNDKLQQSNDELKEKMKRHQVSHGQLTKFKTLLANIQKDNELELTQQNIAEFEKNAQQNIIEMDEKTKAQMDQSQKEEKELMDEVERWMQMEQSYETTKLLLTSEKAKNKKLKQLQLQLLEHEEKRHEMERKLLEYKKKVIELETKNEELTECQIIWQSKGFNKMKFENNNGSDNNESVES